MAQKDQRQVQLQAPLVTEDSVDDALVHEHNQDVLSLGTHSIHITLFYLLVLFIVGFKGDWATGAHFYLQLPRECFLPFAHCPQAPSLGILDRHF